MKANVQPPLLDYSVSSAPYLNYGGVVYQSKGTTTGIVVNFQTADPNRNQPNSITNPKQKYGSHDQIQVNAHGHGIPKQGEGTPFDIIPPFYALVYIMKMV